jgi:hypothetical protein
VWGYLIFQPYAMISVMTKDLEYIVSTNTINAIIRLLYVPLEMMTFYLLCFACCCLKFNSVVESETEWEGASLEKNQFKDLGNIKVKQLYRNNCVLNNLLPLFLFESQFICM